MAAQQNELSSALLGGSLGFRIYYPVCTRNAFAGLLMGEVASSSQGSIN